MMGKTHPPTLAPPKEQAMANPSRLLNQCAITMFPILKNTPLASCQGVSKLTPPSTWH